MALIALSEMADLLNVLESGMFLKPLHGLRRPVLYPLSYGRVRIYGVCVNSSCNFRPIGEGIRLVANSLPLAPPCSVHPADTFLLSTTTLRRPTHPC